MKHIYLNLKRFDVPAQLGGVNHGIPVRRWGEEIVLRIQKELTQYDAGQSEFVAFFPEAHLLCAAEARVPGSPVRLGCQGVFRDDVAPGGNFGAFTTNFPAAAARALGCTHVLIGHCEERKDKYSLLRAAGVARETANETVNRVLNEEIKAVQKQGLEVLYCIGEDLDEQPQWQRVLGDQLDAGLRDVDTRHIVIAYEPIWSIGPGRQPAGAQYIDKAARFIKEHTGGMDVVYGGGLKKENAAMLAAVASVDGGLIALTRFSGEIGFYPEEYLEIVRLYLNG